MRHAGGDPDIYNGGEDGGLGDGPGSEMGIASWREPHHTRRGRGMDPATRKLGLTALSVAGAVIAGLGVYSMIGHRSTVVPVIEADNRPIRVKPENPGGLQINGTNDEISGGDGGVATSRLAPPAEVPEPDVLHAREAEKPAAQKASLAVPAGPTPGVAPPAPAIATRDAPAVHPATPDKIAYKTGDKRPSPPMAPETAKAAGPAAAGKGTLVQFAALGSEEAARTEWAQLNRRIPDLLGGRQPSFSKTERDGKVFWRVRTGGFADMAQATSFCERARAKGTACSIASF